MRQRRTRQEWQALLDEQPRSGLIMQRFCQNEGITPSEWHLIKPKLLPMSAPGNSFTRYLSRHC